MSLATTYCRANVGIEAPLVTVEVHLANGLPAFHIVGLPEKAVQESRERVRCALINSGFEFPARRITVNLAPADLPKEGGRFDLAIAIGILCASGQLPTEALQNSEFIGELTLSGEVRRVTGILPVTHAAKTAKHPLFLPADNYHEACLININQLYPVRHILDLVAHISSQQELPEVPDPLPTPQPQTVPDLSDVRGQEHAKRALMIAAAGRHNLLFSGPPGTGKSMLASRLPGILPPMEEHEAIEKAMIHSIVGKPVDVLNWKQRSYRQPHHTASGVALVGGGSNPRPGEISMAHQGVLFLDEVAEFSRSVLDVLREPMESGHISIARASRQVDFPADFQLIAAMNPCPCGYLGDSRHDCRCTAEQVARYQGKISGPFMDRIDLQVMVPPLAAAELSDPRSPQTATSQEIQKQVIRARKQQLSRQNKPNGKLGTPEIEIYCLLDTDGQELIVRALDSLGLSPRAYHRILRIARTIADLANEQDIQVNHLTEAIGYRKMDRSTGNSTPPL